MQHSFAIHRLLPLREACDHPGKAALHEMVFSEAVKDMPWDMPSVGPEMDRMGLDRATQFEKRHGSPEGSAMPENRSFAGLLRLSRLGA